MIKVQKFIKSNKILLFSLTGYAVLFLYNWNMGVKGLQESVYYFIEMLEILPAVFILTSLIQTWVPTAVIVKNFGSNSKARGRLISFAIGSLSAGPIYAAFPVARTLLDKGATIENIVIILSTWAVVKVPMLINEVKFLGFNYMVVRWILTIVSILIMAKVMDKVVKKEDVTSSIPVKSNNKVIINEGSCVGCEICCKICPSVFEIKDKKASIIGSVKYENHLELIDKAINKCPVKAISK